MFGASFIAWLLGSTLATVDRVEGDSVVVEYQGSYWDTCAHCYPAGLPVEGDRVAFPVDCSEVVRLGDM